MVLRVKDWARFQHYKHRRPPWIRLHRSLLDDPTWHGLPLASRALAPMLWLLASETQDGRIDLPDETLAFRLRLASNVLAEALKPLIAVGWIIESDPASVLLAPCKQDATSEFRDQSTDSLTQNHTDPARDASLPLTGYATRTNPPSTKDRMAAIVEANRRKMLGDA